MDSSRRSSRLEDTSDENINKMCFHASMLDAGFDRVIPLEAFTDPSNGYLIGDCLERRSLFVRKGGGKGECITVDACLMYKHPWRIDKFSKLKYERIESETFTAGGKKWHEVSAVSQGTFQWKGTHVALYLTLVDPKSLLPGFKLLTEVTFRIINQGGHGDHFVGKGKHPYSTSRLSWDWTYFIPLEYLSQADSCYLLKNTCSMEAEVIVHGIAKQLF